MRLLVLVVLACFRFVRPTHSQEISITRYADGDIFVTEGACRDACMVVSSGTAGPYSRDPLTAGLAATNGSCICQCRPEVPVFREDLHICVDDIHECAVAGFLSNSGQIERVPYVFLPQRGQIIYPHAEIQFEGVSTPVCGIAGAQQLGKGGWSELRNLSDTEPPFRLFRDEGRTFLQWVGEAGLRDATEGRLVIAKLVCRDASPKLTNPLVFTPCVAFRVAGSTTKNVREVIFSSSPQLSQGLSATEYTAIGLSSILLALIYVASVSLYLHSRKTKRKCVEEANGAVRNAPRDGGLVKNNPLLAAARHFDSDTNSALTESDLADDLAPSDGEQGFENFFDNKVTSAIVHPHCIYLDHSENVYGSGSILGERLPEEDVRVVETVENTQQQDMPVLPGAQRRKLYFNPAYFDRQLLLAPPPAAIEFLLKIREVISIAKHKMAAKRFIPTLIGIPEEESTSSRCSSSKKQTRAASSARSSKSKKSQSRCTGCPGCTEPTSRNLPSLPETDQTNPGESKVRAWLQDVKPPQRSWGNSEDARRRNFQENARTFAKNLEYLKEMTRGDLQDGTRSLSSWKDNPPMLKTFENIARSEILENDDRHSASKRSTKSMFEESFYERYRLNRRANTVGHFNGDDAINAKVRKAIENSFIKQMEENAAIENDNEKMPENTRKRQVISTKQQQSQISSREDDFPGKLNQRKSKKSKAPGIPQKRELPDMINELPSSKILTKQIMDAVIREMVDVKSLEHHPISLTYEVDSLERSKSSRKSSGSAESTNESSPALSTALPMDEELTMQNAVINTRTGRMTMSKLNKEILQKNYYNNRQKGGAYSLVSEVYVNDGYASPTNSDDSGPEIQYEPENPGHLTIKVQDSPTNYLQQDESEYEPDTLDRKPMKLKVNDDINYEKVVVNEVYVDSLERPAQILLRSKGSFRVEDGKENDPLRRGYGSLREIYEARLRSNLKDSRILNETSIVKEAEETNGHAWKNSSKYLTPERRQAKRQRQPHNQPDVVPLPPGDDIYQRPKTPRRVEEKLSKNPAHSHAEFSENDKTDEKGAPIGEKSFMAGSGMKNFRQQSPDEIVDPEKNCWSVDTQCLLSKNAWDRSCVEAGDPTAGDDSPVAKNSFDVGSVSCACSCKFQGPTKPDTEDRSTVNEAPYRKSLEKMRITVREVGDKQRKVKIEDSGYLSSTDSNGSQKLLLRHEISSVSETDDTESVCDGASESGAESVGTDSVFFGNFRKFSQLQVLSKSVDSGVDVGPHDFHRMPVKSENYLFERNNTTYMSDSETESFVTVLPPYGNRRSNLLS